MNLAFRGGRELAHALRQLPAAVSTNVLVSGVVAGAGIIWRHASAHAPRDTDPRRRRGKRLADTLKVVVREHQRSYVTVHVTTNDPRAHLLEYGHQKVPRGPNRRRVSVTRVSKTGRVSTRFVVDPDEQRTARGATGFVPARPFLRPAFDENRERVLQRIAEVIAKGIELEVRKLNENLTRKAIAGETDPVAQLGVA